MVAALGDNHSFFIGAEQRGQQGPGGAPLGFGTFILSPEFVAMHELDDGALLGITESAAADRTGHVYHEAIAPDEAVAVDWLRYGTDDDPVIMAARRSLRR
jgi:hypothetical protein